MVRRSLPPAIMLAPTPVVLVSCQRKGDKPNIITIAWTGVVCSRPPMVSISIMPSRHSHGIIRDSGEFVVNIPTMELSVETDYCGIVSGRDVDKFKSAGLTPEASTAVNAPSIRECPLSMECKLRNVMQLGTHDLFLGEIVAVTADESVLDGERIELSRLNAITYMPLPHSREYWSVGKAIGRHGYSKGKLGDVHE